MAGIFSRIRAALAGLGRKKTSVLPPGPGQTIVYERNNQVRLGLACLTGPEGLMVGRDYDCGVCFPCDTLGISRHHCSIRWYRGGPAVVDLGSSYGSFLADGRRLPANAPVPIEPGCRFSLGIPG